MRRWAGKRKKASRNGADSTRALVAGDRRQLTDAPVQRRVRPAGGASWGAIVPITAPRRVIVQSTA